MVLINDTFEGATDLDGVAFQDQWQAYLHYLEEVEQIKGGVERYLQTNCWEEATGMTSKQISESYSRFRLSPYHRPTVAVSGAQEAMAILHSRYALHVVTSRPEQERQRTLQELTQFFPHIHFRGHHFGGWNKKADLMKLCKAKFIIEDNIKLALQIAEVAHVIVFIQSANYLMPRHPQLIYLKSAIETHHNMTPHDWEEHARRSWNEIPDLIENVLELRESRRPKVYSNL